jgi:anthranilate synthase/aminodeoxychorismate synthase-like glutamine amidotransferase
VRGRRSGAATLRDLVASIFPGGTITGAPKESVMREIARLEPASRGAYTGSMGYVSGAAVDLNILIRSFTFAGLERGTGEAPAAGAGYLSGGGGVVIESDPETEYLETRHKVEALLKILGKGKGGEAPAAPRPHHSWRPPAVPSRHDGARVLFVENHDSFSYNIVNYLRMLGAEVMVVDQGDAPGFAGASHVVVGPGPGEPATAGRTLDWVRGSLEAGLPYLGICLGHQALGVLLGARLERAPRPVHGEGHAMHHGGRGLFKGLPDPATFTRYNSLVIAGLPPELELEAWTGDDLVMAVRHTSLPAWGVQFHPESMLSPHGLELLAGFLSR